MKNSTQRNATQILVTGATGYIGARLIPRLLDVGYRVRVLVRDPERLSGRPWADQVEVCTGDVFRPDTLPPAMEGVSAAFYLIHSMAGHTDFHDRDIIAAHNFGQAARQAGVGHLIYLSGLGEESDNTLSAHLASRHATGQALRESGIPAVSYTHLDVYKRQGAGRATSAAVSSPLSSRGWSSIATRGAMGVAVGAGVRVGVGSGVRVTVEKARVGRSAVGSPASNREQPATASSRTRRAGNTDNRGFDK